MRSIAVVQFSTSLSDFWKHQRFPVDVMFSDIWIRVKRSNGRSSLQMKRSTYVLFGEFKLLLFLRQNFRMASNCAGCFLLFRKIEQELHC